MARLLLTGASGYIAGTLLNDLIQLPNLKIYALVRTVDQADNVIALGVTPVQFDMSDAKAVKDVLLRYSIPIVIHTAGAIDFTPAKAFIEGLKAVKDKTGGEVHFVHTSGAKMFSSHMGIHRPLNDVTDDLYLVQKELRSHYSVLQTAAQTHISILDLSDSLGVRSYIVVPPMVYGPGTGFGNKISIQFVAIVRMGRDLGEVFQIGEDAWTWPLCHLQDVKSLYLVLLNAILSPSEHGLPPHGKRHGYYFAENGVFSWKRLSQGVSDRLTSHGLIESSAPSVIRKPSQEDLAEIGRVIRSPAALVPLAVSGECALRGDNARKLGWEPQFGVAHLMSVVEEEVDFVLMQDGATKKAQ